MENATTIISSKMKVADLVDMNFHLLGVLSRLGIKPGFGDKTVEDICRENNFHTETLLVICNVYSFDDYLPSARDLGSIKAEDIIRYLRLSHEYYLDSALVVLEESVSKMLEPCRDSHKRIIWQFFLSYKEELRKHFEFEENTVFPHFNALKAGNPGKKALDDIEQGHSSIGEKISDLKNIVMKYLPPECNATDTDATLLYIFFLEEELERHTAIEDKVLTPIMNRLSGNGN